MSNESYFDVACSGRCSTANRELLGRLGLLLLLLLLHRHQTQTQTHTQGTQTQDPNHKSQVINLARGPRPEPEARGDRRPREERVLNARGGGRCCAHAHAHAGPQAHRPAASPLLDHHRSWVMDHWIWTRRPRTPPPWLTARARGKPRGWVDGCAQTRAGHPGTRHKRTAHRKCPRAPSACGSPSSQVRRPVFQRVLGDLRPGHKPDISLAEYKSVIKLFVAATAGCQGAPN
jgi:hypothetical protein